MHDLPFFNEPLSFVEVSLAVQSRTDSECYGNTKIKVGWQTIKPLNGFDFNQTKIV